MACRVVGSQDRHTRTLRRDLADWGRLLPELIFSPRWALLSPLPVSLSLCSTWVAQRPPGFPLSCTHLHLPTEPTAHMHAPTRPWVSSAQGGARAGLGFSNVLAPAASLACTVGKVGWGLAPCSKVVTGPHTGW